MQVDKFDFEVPESLIALNPSNPRDSSKMVEVSKHLEIYKFSNLLNILKKNDCLIINDTKVIPGYLEGKHKSNKINITLNKLIDNRPTVTWSAFIKPQKKISIYNKIIFSKDFYGKIIDINKDRGGEIIIEFNYTYNQFLKLINKHGVLPLPPYITKKRSFSKNDINEYQSIFARNLGAVAAPTASLHFSNDLLNQIIQKGIILVKVTLHINGGTFLPIRTKNINAHKMHYEYGEISEKSAEIINNTRKSGNKCIAVGTTVLRILETAKSSDGQIKAFRGETNIFIKPGWKVNSVDGIITNFHIPKSTLFILVCSIIGIKKAKELYAFAIEKKLRFYSYGDACLIWL